MTLSSIEEIEAELGTPHSLTYDCVVPAFKEEAYIGKLLESLDRQTVKPHCVIVALYALGADRTEEVARSCGAKVVRVDRAGIGYARATGCRRADSDLILNLDADDEPSPDFAERLLGAIEEGNVASFGFGQWSEEEASFPERFFMGLLSVYKHLVPSGQCYGGLMVRRDAYEEVGGFSDMESLEDVDLSFRLAARFPFRVKYVPEAYTQTSIRRLRAFSKNPAAMMDYTKAYRDEKELNIG